ncbi:hypothetical protein G6F68_015602 [Rhizopus microsporus]|nr:hypothetical protein G6F23_014547 [Rhizopus arrhizus]KAG0923663.1 hypothetical protein G6F31_019419 [Rhizopus arrhizus]KAG1244059.1 hypothetical protein G6F68_015602 [Rhizopus microsporus]
MQDIQLLLEQYGGWLVFANVLVEQAGLPVPAYPMLIAAGALGGAAGWLTPWLAATVACLLADSLWYVAGRRFLHPPDAAPVPAHWRAGAAGVQVPARRGCAVHRHGGPDGHRLPPLPAL